jgi:septal ring factor EnvC (AmiA/AmiB activator)
MTRLVPVPRSVKCCRKDLVQHQAHCPTHKAAKAIKSIQKSAKCLEQQLENEYQKRARAETDAATMRRDMNEMEEDREILEDKLIKKDEDLKTIHATNASHQRELAHIKRFREAELDETLKTFFGGENNPDVDDDACRDLAVQLRFKMLPDTTNHEERDAKFARHDSLRSKTTAGSSSGA